MFASMFYRTGPKADLYGSLALSLEAMTADEPDSLANLANAAALLFQALPGINWAGFYVRRGEELVLGPFQGRPACVRIPLGKGVCGTAASKGETLVVPEVEKFPGHISCDAASRSEIVIPLLSEGRVIGVLDVDAPKENRFDAEDQRGLERFAAILAPRVDWKNI